MPAQARSLKPSSPRPAWSVTITQRNPVMSTPVPPGRNALVQRSALLTAVLMTPASNIRPATPPHTVPSMAPRPSCSVASLTTSSVITS